MTRFEIITNRSVESDLLDLIDEAYPGNYYSLVPGTLGRGRQGVRQGDEVWPEKNSLVIIYTETDDKRKAVIRAVKAAKKHFPREGIKVFAFAVEPIDLD